MIMFIAKLAQIRTNFLYTYTAILYPLHIIRVSTISEPNVIEHRYISMQNIYCMYRQPRKFNKRAGGLPGCKQSLPPMETCNPKGFTNVLNKLYGKGKTGSEMDGIRILSLWLSYSSNMTQRSHCYFTPIYCESVVLPQSI